MVTQTTMIQNTREGVQLEDAAHCFSAAGDGKVAEADADDFGKRHGDNGEIVAAQAQRRDADQYAHDARSQAADQQRDQEQPQIRKPFACQRAGYNGGDISADSPIKPTTRFSDVTMMMV